jgi:hypothetical protein
MITWNYRVFREENGDFIIREVFYDDDGAILGCTADAVEPFGQTLEELATSIADMQAALVLPLLTLADMPQPSMERPMAPRGRTFSSAEVRAQLGLHAHCPSSQKAIMDP